MRVVNMHEAKSNLSVLVEQVASGQADEVVIARNGVPAVKIVPLSNVRRDVSRRVGVAAGKYRMPDTFDDSNGIVAELFEGKDNPL